MIPQHSSPPERPRCTHTPVRSRTSHKCMYIQHKGPILYEYRSRMCGRMNPFYMPPPQGTLPRIRMLYPPGIATLIPDGSPPTTGGYESMNMLRRSCGAQCMCSHPLSGRVQASYEANHMQRSVGAPCPQESSNFTQSRRKNRPFSNPSSWAVPKSWRSSERKSFLFTFCLCELLRKQNWSKHGSRDQETIITVPK